MDQNSNFRGLNLKPQKYSSAWVDPNVGNKKVAEHSNFDTEKYNNGDSKMRKLTALLSQPLFSTAMVLIVAGLLSYVIFSSYPSEDEKAIPVIKAETREFRERPQQIGGMQIPYKDNTIYEAMNSTKNSVPEPRIENLLEPASGNSDEAVLDQIAESAINTKKSEAIVLDITNNEDENSDKMVLSKSTHASEIEPPLNTNESTTDTVIQVSETPEIIEIPEAKPIKKSNPKVQETKISSQSKKPEKPNTLHKPGASPETLAFVRSVLEKKDAKKSDTAKSSKVTMNNAAKKLAAVEPSTGAATNSGGGHSYFIQLASIRNEAAAPSEWNKLNKIYASALSGSSYRVQQANLNKGTFYRIQAGPFSKTKANELCAMIKAQKPGACFVTR